MEKREQNSPFTSPLTSPLTSPQLIQRRATVQANKRHTVDEASAAGKAVSELSLHDAAAEALAQVGARGELETGTGAEGAKATETPFKSATLSTTSSRLLNLNACQCLELRVGFSRAALYVLRLLRLFEMPPVPYSLF